MSEQDQSYEVRKKYRLLRAAKRKIRIWLYTLLFHIRPPKWRDSDRRAYI